MIEVPLVLRFSAEDKGAIFDASLWLSLASLWDIAMLAQRGWRGLEVVRAARLGYPPLRVILDGAVTERAACEFSYIEEQSAVTWLNQFRPLVAERLKATIASLQLKGDRLCTS